MSSLSEYSDEPSADMRKIDLAPLVLAKDLDSALVEINFTHIG
ncbi:MAG: hypothetical protein AAGB46_12280 [Verrucomicrobiota bacterium]